EKVIRRLVRRGTLQVHLRYERASAPQDFRINTIALRSYLTQLRSVSDELALGERGDRLLAQVLALPGVVPEPGSQGARLHDDWPIMEQVLQEALGRLQVMRQEEGRAMAQ